MRFTGKTRGCLNTKFRFGLHVRVAKYVVSVGHVTTKFPRMDRFSFSTVMEAPLREFRARELRWLHTSGPYTDLPITSHKYAYSTLVSPAPYLTLGSASRGMNRFQRPANRAFSC